MLLIKIGIIGCGEIHSIHAQAIMNQPDLALAAVADADPAKAKAAAEKYGCGFTCDYHDLLLRNDIDSIHVCTPHHLHARMAIDALRSGKHALTEKPMAIKTEDAKLMNRASRESGRRLGVCFQNRYSKTNAWVKSLLRSGSLGAPLGARAFVTWDRKASYYNQAPWRGTWEQEGGGVLINQAIHTVDILGWYLGKPICAKASMDTRRLKGVIEVEDTAEALIKFENGANLLLYATNCHLGNPPPFVEIVCEKGTARIEDEAVVAYNDGRRETAALDELSEGDKHYWGSSHGLLIRDFYDKIVSGEQFALSGEEGLKALEIVDGIYESAKTGREVFFM